MGGVFAGLLVWFVLEVASQLLPVVLYDGYAIELPQLVWILGPILGGVAVGVLVMRWRGAQASSDL